MPWIQIAVEFALNAVIGTAAILLWQTLTPWVVKGKSVSLPRQVVTVKAGPPAEPERSVPPPKSPQYIDLSTLSVPVRRPERSATAPRVRPVADGRRDRSEVIRTARLMLETGTSVDEIRAHLPVTEGELALLKGR